MDEKQTGHTANTEALNNSPAKAFGENSTNGLSRVTTAPPLTKRYAGVVRLSNQRLPSMPVVAGGTAAK